MYLATKITKKEKEIDFFQVFPLAQTEAFSYMLKAWAEAVDSGYAPPKTYWSDVRTGAVYAKYQDKIIGMIVYTPADILTSISANDLYIIIGHVKEEFRGEGIYKLLHSTLEEFCVKNKFKGILSRVDVRNKIMLDICDNLGKNLTGLSYYKKIKKNE